MKIWIRDNTNGKVFEYGKDSHDSLHISEDGRYLTYYNLQNGDGSEFGSLEKKQGYNFVVDGLPLTPNELSERTGCIEHATDSYANIGGFKCDCKCKKDNPETEKLIADLEFLDDNLEFDTIRDEDNGKELDVHEVLEHAICLLKGEQW